MTTVPWEPVVLVGFMAFSLKNHKNHDYPAPLRSLQGKKSPDWRFLRILRAKRNKLLGTAAGAG
jgi:hypothetical protein